MTREEKTTVVLATLGCLAGLAAGYRWGGGRMALWFLALLVVGLMAILFAAGVQLGKGSRPWQPRMLLALVAPIVVVGSGRVGGHVADIDFKHRRMKHYEAFIATIEAPPTASKDDWIQVPDPVGVNGGLPILARRTKDGLVQVEFVWDRHREYVHCGGECEWAERWRGTHSLGDHWFVAYR